MRTAYHVMTVAAKSSAECAASDSKASEPDSRPTTVFAIVSPPEAAIEVSATRSLSACISCVSLPASGGLRNRQLCRLVHCLAIFLHQARAKLRGRRHVFDAADALASRPDVLPRAF